MAIMLNALANGPPATKPTEAWNMYTCFLGSSRTKAAAVSDELVKLTRLWDVDCSQSPVRCLVMSKMHLQVLLPLVIRRNGGTHPAELGAGSFVATNGASLKPMLISIMHALMAANRSRSQLRFVHSANKQWGKE
ncbi:hypothetical protein M5D96_003599 [Drosophila gunungcola]|uniref:Uncharacterized protein n=1 Tax=Drosophila gunungcola TaxID=103775 RepID=A0A9P9YSJ6_9MUSC|nr:hypothetical protein M5D96_003599 [Drosophila gunungcola]